ncbi:unnamed protein product [Cuscuta campestris]|uniref:Retrotransposon gag domain-containing protein n=1 Tax=Cuscuta campestris TaxID=132261 RepID=A0A484M4E0_9ASTE|nr:unnamed protein product [Cuscuta campestris]
MDKAGPSRSRRSRSRRSRTQITPDGDVRSVQSRDEDWDVPQAQKKLKGKAIQPEGSRRSAFQRLGHEGRNQNRPAKERLGVETTPLSAFDRMGRGAERPGRTRRTEPPHREEPQHSRAPHGEEEAERHSRHTIRSNVEQPRDRVGRVEARLEKLQRRVDRDEKKKILLNESPFTDRVHETPFPKKAKLEVPKFTGKEDPEIDVKTLHQSGRMMGLSGDEKCLLFFQTLRGRAAEWFHNLLAGEIDSFDELAEVFQEKFKENCTKRKKFTYLSTAGQREHEDLTKFLTRWKDEVDKVEEMDDKTAMSLLVSGLRSGELYKEFCRRPPKSYQEAYNTAWDYADAEAQVSSKREAEQGHSKGKISLKKEIKQPGRAKAEVMEVKPVKTEKKPDGEKQWTEKYCSFHKTDSHNTAECNSVKGVIKQMIEAGELDPEYLAQSKQKKNQWIRPEGKPVEQNKKNKAPGKEHLQVIYGGPEGGDSASQRKKWGRELYVGTVALDPRRKQTRREPITFTDRDFPATGEDHNDPLVITMDMGEVNVSRVLVDMGSSVNVLYLDAFEKLKLCRTRLEPLKTPLSGFTGDSVEAEGSILLTCGSEHQMCSQRHPRPAWNKKVHGVISMAHLCMKFYTPGDMLSKLTQACPEHVSKLAKIEILDVPSADRFEVAAIQPGQTSATGIIGPDDDWRYDLMEYLETGQKPDDEERARKGNGQVENAPDNCGRSKKRLGEEGHKWLEALPHTVWAHRVTSRRATGETPFVLTYGCEARLPVEAEIPTFRETVYQPDQNEVNHLVELNLVEERRTIAAVKMAGYQQSVKRYHDNRVGPRYFQVHDEVLRRRDASKPNERGKLVRNWEGPYRVKAIVRPGTYQLETMEGGRVDRHWNSHHLRKFSR